MKNTKISLLLILSIVLNSFSSVIAQTRTEIQIVSPPSISSFTLSGLSGDVNLLVEIANAGTGSIISCGFYYQDSFSRLAFTTNRDGSTTCEGVFSLGRGQANSEDFTAVATNSENAVARLSSPRILSNTVNTIELETSREQIIEESTNVRDVEASEQRDLENARTEITEELDQSLLLLKQRMKIPESISNLESVPVKTRSERAFIDDGAIRKSSGTGDTVFLFGLDKVKKQDQSNLPNGNGGNNLFKTGEVSIDVKNGFLSGVDLNTESTPQGVLTLALEVDKDPNSQSIYGTDVTLTKKKTQKLFTTYKGEELNRVWWRVSTAPFFLSSSCPNQNTEKYKGNLKNVWKNGSESFFLDLGEFFTPAMKNGTYGGAVTYYVQAIGEGKKSIGCASLYSNVVRITVMPSAGFLSLYNPSAKKPVLYTTGNQFKKTGEFTGDTDVIALDWTKPNSEQLLHFNFPGNDAALIGRWQITLVPPSPVQCLNPTGLIAQGDVSLVNKNQNLEAFSIKFNEVALNKYIAPKSGMFGFLNDVNTKVADAFSAQGEDFMSKYSAKDFSYAEKETNAIYDTYVKGKKNISYYIRYVGIDASGDCTTTHQPSTYVTVNYGELQKQTIKVPKFQTHQVEMATGSFAITGIDYAPVEFQKDPFNPTGHYVYVKDYQIPTTQKNPDGSTKMQIINKKGDKIYISPPPSSTPPKSFWDKLSIEGIIGGISDFVSFVETMVNFTANTYNSLKSTVASTMASGISALGVPCDAACKAVIEGGLSIGQAALGIPPSLPDFDKLMTEGIDYLAKEAAMQIADATGVPGADILTEEIVRESLKKTVKELETQFSSHVKSSPLYIAPDPDYLYKPAKIVVKVKNTQNFRQSGTLQLIFRDNTVSPELEQHTRDMFISRTISIPTLGAGETLSIPVSLEENYDAYRKQGDTDDPSCLPPSACINHELAIRLRKERWENVFKSGMVTFTISAMPVARLNLDFNPNAIGINTNGWQKISATPYENLWIDSSGDYHKFIPVISLDQKKESFKTITQSPAKSFGFSTAQ